MRKARIQERGAEIDRLMSLGGTPLLVDMSVNADNGATASSNATALPRDHEPEPANPSGNSDQEKVAHVATAVPHLGEQKISRTESGAARKRSWGAKVPVGSNDTKVSSTSSSPPKEQQSDTLEEREYTQGPESLEGLDANRVKATESTPLLPSFSLGSRLALHGQLSGKNCLANLKGFPVSRQVELCASPSADDIARTSACGHLRGGKWTGRNSNRASGSTFHTGGALIPTKHDQGDGGGGAEGSAEVAAEKVATVINKCHANALLASHLTPFPTITKNRSLHAVPQPIVQHSEGFADACRGESSRLGNAAWRVSRATRFDGLVATADRLSIVRQIEAGFDALHGRRVSPMA